MNESQYEALKATMPWRMHITPTNMGGLVRILNNKNQEVPLLEMAKFLEVVTSSIARQQAKKEVADGQA